MGAGRRTYAHTLKKGSDPDLAANSSYTARNLRKSDLYGVILGCTHHTIDECHSKKLFGLPAPHMSYIKSVVPGMPLFLFNYSDRKLHGIFEATSYGQLNIDSGAWTGDGSQYTQYGAQVRVKVRMECKPLLEAQFKPIIANNYYEQKLFWFELDQGQTRKLISLFSSSPIIARTARTTHNVGPPSLEVDVAVPSNVERTSFWDSFQLGGKCQLPQPLVNEETAKDYEQQHKSQNQNSVRSYSSVVKNMKTCDPQLITMEPLSELEDWSNVTFQLHPSVKEKVNQSCEQLESQNPRSYCSVAKDAITGHLLLTNMGPFSGGDDQSNVEHDSVWDTSDFVQPSIQEEATKNCVRPQQISVGPFSGGEDQSDVEQDSIWDTSDFVQPSIQVEETKNCVRPQLISVGPFPKEESHPSATLTNPSEEEHRQVNSCAASEDMNSDKHGEVTAASSVNELHREDKCSLKTGQLSEMMKSSALQTLTTKLMNIAEEFTTIYLAQTQKISCLENELEESKRVIQQLRYQNKMLESGSFCSHEHVEGVESLLVGPRTNLQESLFLVGGFDGSSWLSALDIYSPARDILKPLRPMTHVRSYASVAKLSDQLYILGGMHGDLWYNTVESYNPISNEWADCPSLNQRKGSLAGISLNNKIFAIGGGNGVNCFSEVEMLDPNVGHWILARSMFHKRYAPAAAEINGALYVSGGFDGNEYLKSVERFDPREHSWTRVASMNSSRGCHCLAVLNDKLYALGGYDGEGMISTNEVLDPRMGSWLTVEPMNFPRGYFGAAAMGDSIYAFGGATCGHEILDNVECYNESRGWCLTDLKAIGKRSFFSAVV